MSLVLHRQYICAFPKHTHAGRTAVHLYTATHGVPLRLNVYSMDVMKVDEGGVLPLQLRLCLVVSVVSSVVVG